MHRQTTMTGVNNTWWEKTWGGVPCAPPQQSQQERRRGGVASRATSKITSNKSAVASTRWERLR